MLIQAASGVGVFALPAPLTAVVVLTASRPGGADKSGWTEGDIQGEWIAFQEARNRSCIFFFFFNLFVVKGISKKKKIRSLRERDRDATSDGCSRSLGRWHM